MDRLQSNPVPPLARGLVRRLHRELETEFEKRKAAPYRPPHSRKGWLKAALARLESCLGDQLVGWWPEGSPKKPILHVIVLHAADHGRLQALEHRLDSRKCEASIYEMALSITRHALERRLQRAGGDRASVMAELLDVIRNKLPEGLGAFSAPTPAGLYIGKYEVENGQPTATIITFVDNAKLSSAQRAIQRESYPTTTGTHPRCAQSHQNFED